MRQKKTTSRYQKVYNKDRLYDAWKQVRRNGLQSDSDDTRKKIKLFEANERKNIERIHRQLYIRKFTFDKNKAAMSKKKKRPIVISPVESRIVQRAILDVLQTEPGIEKYLRSKGSYRAIKSFHDQKKGVPPAVNDVLNAIKDGAANYYKSDIESFFTKIPRAKVINDISTIIDDKEFISILEAATNLEIDNMSTLPESDRKFFDFNEVGTPQGCCLSPLLGNILLYDFDQEMNQNGISCFRYLDDFIILGPNPKAVNNAFKKAVTILGSLGLNAYKLNDNSKKAKAGLTSDKFQFLGIKFNHYRTRPSKESRKKLFDSIKAILKSSENQGFSTDKNIIKQYKYSLIKTLHKINNKFQGWVMQYRFCNDGHNWLNIDQTLDDLLSQYLKNFKRKWKSLESLDTPQQRKQKRRLIGIHLIKDKLNNDD